MDDNTVMSVGILLVNDDRTSNDIVAGMLRHPSCQVLRTGGLLDVLIALWEKKDMVDLVLTNVHKLSDGEVTVRHIEETLHLHVIPIYTDNRKIESEGQTFSFSVYVINGSSRNGETNLWQYEKERQKDKMVAVDQGEKVERASISSVAAESNKPSSSIGDAARLDQKLKGVELSEGSKNDRRPPKKPRVVWKADMHEKFLEAIAFLGPEKAVPKKIVEVMNIPGLTRENVASHLQKYRGTLKRNQETVFTSFSGVCTRNEFEGLGVLSSPSTTRLGSLHTNMTASLRSSYRSTAKEPVSPYQSRYLKTRKDFSFGTTSDRKACYTSVGSSLYNGRSGVDRLQQEHDSKLQLNPNFRIYSDPKRNMLLSIEKNSSSDRSHPSSISKFVGYRVTSDGSLIEYGDFKASIDEIKTEAVASNPGGAGNQSTSYIQHNSILDQSPFASTGDVFHQPCLLGSPAADTSFQGLSALEIHGIENPIQSTTASVLNLSRQQALLSSHGQKIEDLFNLDPATPISSTSKQHISVQPFQDFGIEDTENHHSFLDQDTHLRYREAPADIARLHNPPENDASIQNASTPSSIFPGDQDFLTPLLETPGDEFRVQSPAAFVEGISEQYYSPSPLPQMLQYFDDFFDQSGNDDGLLKGTGSLSYEFDLEEFDDALFSQDAELFGKHVEY